MVLWVHNLIAYLGWL